MPGDRVFDAAASCAYSLIIANAHDEDPYNRDTHVPLTANIFNSPRVTALLSR
ncbi:hypothetical protein [Kribbella sp. VKM Ac-2566]|uniref:hypothetical protein n=1 Tax=Kribbella sp. VKM Ac-2566 TaxID=2512218 RepID=UPI0010DF53BC|nr:hypothetical protein [Kribbella sp. VKM Ac-2566]TDW91230.1 hypothetical protein EV647_4808 [Kribbella sp. VKM Ac-2566]